MKDGIKIIGMEETMAVLDQIREDFPQKSCSVRNKKNSMKPFVKEIVKANNDVPETKKSHKIEDFESSKRYCSFDGSLVRQRGRETQIFQE